VSRRPGYRNNRGRVAIATGGAAPVVTTPITILEAIRAGSAIQWQRPDLGVTLNGGNVSAWADQTANANHDTQGTAASQPLWIASVAAANNEPAIQFDNVDDYLDCAIARPAPATTSTLIWCVLRQDAWTASDSLFAAIHATLNAMRVIQVSGSPLLQMMNTAGVNNNTGAPIGDVKRAAFFFSGSTNDFSNVGSVLATGGNSGNTAGSTGYRKGANRTAGTFAALTLFDWAMASGFTPAEAATAVTNLDAYATSRYGAGIIT
jgi:hypothetical protein